MDDAEIRALRALNRRFYDDNAASFVAKRQRPWNGWRRLLPRLPPGARVLDAACGHGRFLAFLEAEAPDPDRRYVGVDACEPLLAEARRRWPGPEPRFERLDLLDADLTALGRFDLVVAFGLLHHIPTAALREDLTRRLAGPVSPGGHLVLALWRVDAAKTRPEPEGLSAGPGDAFLGWGPNPEALRFCHDVDETEAQALVAQSGLQPVDDYRDDGGGDRNRYLVLRRA